MGRKRFDGQRYRKCIRLARIEAGSEACCSEWGARCSSARLTFIPINQMASERPNSRMMILHTQINAICHNPVLFIREMLKDKVLLEPAGTIPGLSVRTLTEILPMFVHDMQGARFELQKTNQLRACNVEQPCRFRQIVTNFMEHIQCLG